MSRAADGPHPHPLTLADLPPGDDDWVPAASTATCPSKAGAPASPRTAAPSTTPAVTTATAAPPSPSGSITDKEALMAVQTAQADTFNALDTCFTADLAALIGSQPTRSLSPTRFIDLVEEVRDLLADSRLPHYEDASDDLDHAADHLTEALTSPADEQRGLLAQARTHLRAAIAAAS